MRASIDCPLVYIYISWSKKFTLDGHFRNQLDKLPVIVRNLLLSFFSNIFWTLSLTFVALLLFGIATIGLISNLETG